MEFTPQRLAAIDHFRARLVGECGADEFAAMPGTMLPAAGRMAPGFVSLAYLITTPRA